MLIFLQIGRDVLHMLPNLLGSDNAKKWSAVTLNVNTR